MQYAEESYFNGPHFDAHIDARAEQFKTDRRRIESMRAAGVRGR